MKKVHLFQLKNHDNPFKDGLYKIRKCLGTIYSINWRRRSLQKTIFKENVELFAAMYIDVTFFGTKKHMW